MVFLLQWRIADQSPTERRASFDIAAGGAAENFFQMARVQAVGRANRAQVLARENFPRAHVRADEKGAAKSSALLLGRGQTVVDPPEHALRFAHAFDHGAKFARLERERAIRTAAGARAGKMFFDNAGSESHRRYRRAGAEGVIGES